MTQDVQSTIQQTFDDSAATANTGTPEPAVTDGPSFDEMMGDRNKAIISGLNEDAVTSYVVRLRTEQEASLARFQAKIDFAQMVAKSGVSIDDAIALLLEMKNEQNGTIENEESNETTIELPNTTTNTGPATRGKLDNTIKETVPPQAVILATSPASKVRKKLEAAAVLATASLEKRKRALVESLEAYSWLNKKFNAAELMKNSEEDLLQQLMLRQKKLQDRFGRK